MVPSVLRSSVCWSLQYLLSALTKEVGGGQLFRLTCSFVLWGLRNTTNKYQWREWGVLPVSQAHWVWPRSRHVCFPRLHCSDSRLLCRELSEACPRLYALPMSKPLRFRYSGNPQKRRLSCAWILCPSQVGASPATRCLASAVAPPYCLSLACCSFFCVYNWRIFSGRY